MLDAVAAVDLHLAMVVDPRHAEHDDALGFDQAVQQAMLGIFRMLAMNGHRLSITSVTACRNSGWPGLRLATWAEKFVTTFVFHGLGCERKGRKAAIVHSSESGPPQCGAPREAFGFQLIRGVAISAGKKT